jgi:4,5-dihydroxyphthalate decarboxylase
MSDPVRLKTAIATRGHTAALKDGGVAIDGATLDFVEVTPIIAAFRRMVRHLEFDVCEMAPTAWYAGPIPASASRPICTASRSACEPIR